MIFILILLSSCASSNKVKNNFSNIADIKNTDFKPVKQVKYTKKLDRYSKMNFAESSATNKESLQRIIRFDGNFKVSDTLTELAELCYLKKFDDAFLKIRNTSRIYVKNPIFWNQVGNCYLLKGDKRKALLFYNKALSLEKDYSPALNNLGVMYYGDEDYSRALVAFQKAIRSGDFKAVPRLNLANLYLSYGLYEDAIKLTAGLASKNATDLDILNILGSAYLMKGDFKTSLKYFSQINTDFLESATYGINYSLALFKSGRKSAGVDAMESIDKKNLGAWKSYYFEVKTYMGVK